MSTEDEAIFRNRGTFFDGPGGDQIGVGSWAKRRKCVEGLENSVPAQSGEFGAEIGEGLSITRGGISAGAKVTDGPGPMKGNGAVNVKGCEV